MRKNIALAGALLLFTNNLFAEDCNQYEAGSKKRSECELDNRQRERQNGASTSSQSSPGSSRGEKCQRKLTGVNEKADALPPTTPFLPLAKANLYNTEVLDCIAFKLMAESRGSTLDEGVSAPQPTMDGKTACFKPEGFTLDFDSCSSTLKLYNAIIILEQGMLAVQRQQVQNNGQRLSAGVAAEAAKGNGQNAALNANAQDNAFKGQLSMQQATAYGAAVSALSAKVLSWQKKDEGSLSKLCKTNVVKVTGDPSVDETIRINNCQKAMTSQYTNNSYVFANDAAKTFFTAASFELARKAAEALANAKRFKNISDTVKKVADSTAPDPDGPTLADCAAGSTDPRCVTYGPRTPLNPTIEPGNFDIGNGGGNNNFGNTTGGDDKFGEEGTAAAPAGETVANVNNPFAEEAKKANDILNPAPAAQISGGQNPGGGGAGGGAGGGGGGGSALGNDLKGVDEEGEKSEEIKPEKLSGSYASAKGGGGFSGPKGGLNNDNPFASLFDKKGEGRTTASEEEFDVNQNKEIPLFQIISRKHAQVHADKRIEANNLE